MPFPPPPHTLPQLSPRFTLYFLNMSIPRLTPCLPINTVPPAQASLAPPLHLALPDSAHRVTPLGTPSPLPLDATGFFILSTLCTLPLTSLLLSSHCLVILHFLGSTHPSRENSITLHTWNSVNSQWNSWGRRERGERVREGKETQSWKKGSCKTGEIPAS